MRAEILSVGSEILLGDIADTNTQYLAQRLSALGIDLFFSTTVGDNRGRLLDCLKRAIARSDLVLTTGGLGPTDDDVTRESIADLFGETPEIDEHIARLLRAFFKRRGIEMTDNNLKQASLIPSARAVRNERGTAPGWWVEKDGHTVIAMPGPPGELHHMWEHEIEPTLRRDGTIILSRSIKLFAISESKVDSLIADLTPSNNPTIGVYAKQDGIHIRITAKAGSESEAARAIVPVEAEVRRLLGEFVWGADDDTQESVVVNLLRAHGVTIGVYETVTGGQVTSMLTGAPEVSTVLKGALVVPLNPNREPLELARLAREEFSSDIGVATSGSVMSDAEPPMYELQVAVSWPARSYETTATHRSRPYRVRTLGAYYALHELRRALS
jgi:nicotinamide-nucleotide amidase